MTHLFSIKRNNGHHSIYSNLNFSKLPCDVNLQVRPVNNKMASKITDIFDVDPLKTQIAPHSYVYATVFFSPKSIQEYDCVFEASVESQVKCKSLIFNVHGEGSLPRVQIISTTKNGFGNGVLNFRPLRTGQSEGLSLTLRNTSKLPARVTRRILKYAPEVKPEVPFKFTIFSF